MAMLERRLHVPPEHLFPVDEWAVIETRSSDRYLANAETAFSLSACVQSIVAAEVGHDRAALSYFRYALLMDLADVAGNVSDGAHIACAAGVWQALVFGFGGIHDRDGRLSICPHLPPAWTSLSFTLRVRDRQLRVHVSHDEERYLLVTGPPLEVTVRGQRRLLSPGAALVVDGAGRLPATTGAEP